jgi:hypothetical protein
VDRILTQEVTALNPVHQALLTDLATSEVELESLRARRKLVSTGAEALNKELGSLTTIKSTWTG